MSNSGRACHHLGHRNSSDQTRTGPGPWPPTGKGGIREKKPPTQRPSDLNWAGPQGLAKGRGQLSPHRTGNRKKEQSSPKPTQASLTESPLYGVGGGEGPTLFTGRLTNATCTLSKGNLQGMGTLGRRVPGVHVAGCLCLPSSFLPSPQSTPSPVPANHHDIAMPR